jgi:hypothetical protein
MMEYTTIGQAALETDRVDGELVEQSPLPTKDGEEEVDNDIDDENLDDDVDMPLRFHNISDNLRTVGFAPCALVVDELHMVRSDELASFAKAERNPG